MSHPPPIQRAQTADWPNSSPLRNPSIASTASSAYTNYSNQFGPSRTSTISSVASSGYARPKAGHKRAMSELAERVSRDGYNQNTETSPSSAYKSIRQSLRPLSQPPNASPSTPTSKTPPSRPYSPHHVRGQSVDSISAYQSDGSPYLPSTKDIMQSPLSRTDSINPGLSSPHRHMHHAHPSLPPTLTEPELQDLKKSSTSHLRNLSKLAQSGQDEEFSITSPIASVVGLQGRRQLKRTDTIKPGKGGPLANRNRYTWNGSNWMDKQRQFLQAYEYLCHIGEAKEWIEDIIDKPIPAIIQLEEALRDGVTLAEIVQALNPDRPMRIFRHPRLQFRHSDNIAIFFRYLAEVELPELFRFELIDLYEKKNIPKVIYCIHALSWLLFRKGIVDFRIGNLVGQLQFEHHELEEMQKGLDKAGISMPSFAGVGANFGAEPEPEPEPVETEEERTARELGEQEAMVLDLQAQVRGAMVRLRLGSTMQGLWDAEEMLIDLQSRIRGDWARQISDYRLNMKRFSVNLQSAARGFLTRSRNQRREEGWKGQEDKVLMLQSLFRAGKARQETQHIKTRVRKQEEGIRRFQAAIRGALKRQETQNTQSIARDQEEGIRQLQAAIRGALQRQETQYIQTVMRKQEEGIRNFQAAIRGALQRKKFDDQYEETKEAEAGLDELQAAVRGMLERQNIQRQIDLLSLEQQKTTILQAVIRAMMERKHIADTKAKLEGFDMLWTALQAASKSFLLRKVVADRYMKLKSESSIIAQIQAAQRGSMVRKDLQDLREQLASHEESLSSFQSFVRGFLLRQVWRSDLEALVSHTSSIIQLQARARARLARAKQQEFLFELGLHEEEITLLQALSRAMLVRIDVGDVLAHLENEEPVIVELQALARGCILRAQFAEKQRYYEENMQKVVKLQSFVRGRQQGEAYKSLTSGKNPPVSTIKNFVHLLNDSDFDFDEEIEFERLRKTVVQHVRQNELADQYIQQLDIKIALLVKNKITLDEVIKHQKHFGGHVSNLLTNSEISSKDPFDLKALNKTSRRKLEHYQELFFLLQTQPQYLARFFRRIREQTTAEKECERIKHLMMGTFGYAQKRREEYYLLKLLSRSIHEEVSQCQSMQDYLRGNFFWIKLFGAYTKSPRDRKYMRDFLGPLIRGNIIENPHLNLESDPLQIYQGAISNEELRTGQRSRRPLDVTREEAIKDPETRDIFVNNLRDLRDIADQFYASLEDLLMRMPFGVRYIAQQTFRELCTRFQNEDQGYLLQVVGQWVWRYYLAPALCEPEKHGVVDRGLSQEHKRNLMEVIKLLSQIAGGKLFGPQNVFLQPLNSYVSESIARLGEIWGHLISVQEAETYFDIDEFNDLYAKTKPTLYIKMGDIFSIHQLVIAELAAISPNQDDVLREVMRELGSAKTNETEMMTVGSSEIGLTLSPKYHDVEDPDAEVNALFMETKRCVLYIIRVQQGTNLMDIMVKPILLEDEERWEGLVRDELSTGSRKRGAYSEENTIMDIASMSYAELKQTALENILQLEQFGRLTRKNQYQDLLNAIAIDIRTKHRRRIQRQRELEGVRLTLARLDDQAVYLDQQLQTYNDYIEQAMVTLQNKKGKKRFLMPFTKQWDHQRELQRSGRVVKFGSFKYSARTLADKGVLVHWMGYTERQWDKVDLTISSNEVGVFAVEGSNGNIQIPGASAQIPLDDLLQAQFNNTQFMDFFKGELRVNVNLFLHLIMKKFYND